MAYTVKGKRVAFDNVAYASVTGREATIHYGDGTSTTIGTTNLTTPYGNQERLLVSPGITSAAGSAIGREYTMRTVCGGATSDFTTDLGH